MCCYALRLTLLDLLGLFTWSASDVSCLHAVMSSSAGEIDGRLVEGSKWYSNSVGDTGTV